MPSVPLHSLTERYAFLDPAGGSTQQKKSNQARTAIICVAANQTGHVFVLHAWAGRISPTEIMERCFECIQLWHPRVFGVEASAQQSLFAGVLAEEALKRGYDLPLELVHQPPQLHKDERIRAAVQPMARAGRLFIQPHHHELNKELQTFPTGMTKDLVDALASAINLIPPRLLAARQSSSSLDAAKADYMQRLGMTPSPETLADLFAKSL